MACRAYQVSDQMACSCGLRWDLNDLEPPKCAVKLAEDLAARGRLGTRPYATAGNGRTPSAETLRRNAPKPAKTAEALEVEQLAAVAKEYERAMMEHRAMPYAARQVKAMRSALKFYAPPVAPLGKL